MVKAEREFSDEYHKREWARAMKEKEEYEEEIREMVMKEQEKLRKRAEDAARKQARKDSGGRGISLCGGMGKKKKK